VIVDASQDGRRGNEASKQASRGHGFAVDVDVEGKSVGMGVGVGVVPFNAARGEIRACPGCLRFGRASCWWCLELSVLR